MLHSYPKNFIFIKNSTPEPTPGSRPPPLINNPPGNYDYKNHLDFIVNFFNTGFNYTLITGTANIIYGSKTLNEVLQPVSFFNIMHGNLLEDFKSTKATVLSNNITYVLIQNKDVMFIKPFSKRSKDLISIEITLNSTGITYTYFDDYYNLFKYDNYTS